MNPKKLMQEIMPSLEVIYKNISRTAISSDMDWLEENSDKRVLKIGKKDFLIEVSEIK